jgi:[ribosomal protein S5]-alanine N-acetyltransferase
MQVPVLETARLQLRPLTEADAAAILPFSFYDGIKLETDAAVKDKLHRIEADIRAGQSLHWGLERKSAPGIIGTIGFYRGFRHSSGEIGYVLHEQFRQQGLMQEALAAVVAYGFADLQLYRIFALTSQDNLASGKLLGRAGFSEAVSGNGNYIKFVLRRPRP